MPGFNITMSDAALLRLQTAVDDFNVATGQSITLEEWVILSLAQRAIEKELNAEVEVLKREHDAELPRLIDARRRVLLQAVGVGRAVRVSPDDTG